MKRKILCWVWLRFGFLFGSQTSEVWEIGVCWKLKHPQLRRDICENQTFGCIFLGNLWRTNIDSSLFRMLSFQHTYTEISTFFFFYVKTVLHYLLNSEFRFSSQVYAISLIFKGLNAKITIIIAGYDFTSICDSLCDTFDFADRCLDSSLIWAYLGNNFSPVAFFCAMLTNTMYLEIISEIPERFCSYTTRNKADITPRVICHATSV